ncbi:MAG: DUF4410 domain-containing protein [Kofleriaceae bacterium]|nr:DUF4410 domain-containing protein [Kofleriaceae bacterium]
MPKSAHALVLAGLAVALALSGCASAPKPTPFTPPQVALEKGKHVDRVWADAAALAAARVANVALSEIDTRAIADAKGITAAEARETLRGALVAGAGGDVVLRHGLEGSTSRLEVAITELDPGSAAARVFAGELGAGHAWVQVEARLVDPASGAVLAAFVERSRDSGGIGLRDTFGSVGPTLVRELLQRAARDIRDELAIVLPGEAGAAR